MVACTTVLCSLTSSNEAEITPKNNFKTKNGSVMTIHKKNNFDNKSFSESEILYIISKKLEFNCAKIQTRPSLQCCYLEKSEQSIPNIIKMSIL